jgi:prepilin-type N-terminal cleavage/methylation domain-containing protein
MTTSRTEAASRRAGRRRGVTLIEMLLVLAIVGIAAAITVPNFVKSIRGNRLRTAGRVVIKAGRYARSMAVLQQKDVIVTFRFDPAAVAVGEAENYALERVRVEWVELRETAAADRRTEGACSIVYRPNGTCTPYQVRLADESGAWLLVDVDALSSARTEGREG